MRMLRRPLNLGQLVVFTLLGSCGASVIPPLAEMEGGEDELIASLSTSEETSDTFGYQLVYTDLDFIGRLDYEEGVLAYEELYRDSSSASGWVNHRYEYSTSFDIRQVVSQKQQALFLCGSTVSGVTVIERWRIKKSLGSGGQPWQPGGPIAMMRTELYRGTTMGAVVTMDVDPDGRFLLVLGGVPRTLFRLSTTPGSAPGVELTSQQVPILTDITGMAPLQHRTEGRVWILEGSEILNRLMLFDSANDGVFESRAVIDDDTFASTYDGPVWDDVFIVGGQ